MYDFYALNVEHWSTHGRCFSTANFVLHGVLLFPWKINPKLFLSGKSFSPKKITKKLKTKILQNPWETFIEKEGYYYGYIHSHIIHFRSFNCFWGLQSKEAYYIHVRSIEIYGTVALHWDVYGTKKIEWSFSLSTVGNDSFPHGNGLGYIDAIAAEMLVRNERNMQEEKKLRPAQLEFAPRVEVWP
jgi:hypothetical protein